MFKTSINMQIFPKFSFQYPPPPFENYWIRAWKVDTYYYMWWGENVLIKFTTKFFFYCRIFECTRTCIAKTLSLENLEGRVNCHPSPTSNPPVACDILLHDDSKFCVEGEQKTRGEIFKIAFGYLFLKYANQCLTSTILLLNTNHKHCFNVFTFGIFK